jgi:hypothetical protein
MPYVTQSDYETRYGAAELAALCDRERAGVPDDAVWEQLTQTEPVTGFVLQVAVPTGTNQAFIRIGEPILIGD